MKETFSLALLVVSTNTFAALQCPSNSTVIYSNDWHKYQTNLNTYVIDSSIGEKAKPICLSTKQNPTPTAPIGNKENPIVSGGNVMTFKYPVIFSRLYDYTIVGEGYNLSELNRNPKYSPSYSGIPIFVSDFRTTDPTVSVENSNGLKLYYIRAQNNSPAHEFTAPSLKIKDSHNVQLKHAELGGANGVLSFDSSSNLKAIATGIVCKYYCIANIASPRAIMEQVSVHQNYSDLPHDTHATISILANNDPVPSTINFTRSNFLIETGTAFAVSSLTGFTTSDRTRSTSEITLDDSRIEIRKASNTQNKSYGWSFHHANYGMLEINITANNTFVLDGKFLSAASMQVPSNLVSRVKNENIPYFYQDEDYSPSHHILKNKQVGETDSKFIKVCIGGVCKFSTDRGIYNFEQEITNLGEKESYNDGEVGLCQKAKLFYHYNAMKHIESVCDLKEPAARINADK